MQALVGGRLFNVDYQRRWLDSLRPEDPSKPQGQQYEYDITQIRFGPNSLYFRRGQRRLEDLGGPDLAWPYSS